MFDHEQLETTSIQTLTSDSDLSALMRRIKRTPQALRDGTGPLGHQPTKMYLRFMPGFSTVGISCSYGAQDDYLLAGVGDTVIEYADGTFCILPTGTPAKVGA